MKCKRCGKELEKNARFCVNCGNEVNNQKEPKQKKKGILLKIIIVEIVCILAVIVGLFVAYFLPKVGQKLTLKDSCVTRYEWIEMLCEQFNIEESETSQLTYTDVDEEYEAVISNAYGRGILSGKGKFEGDEPALGEFIAITTIRAIGESEVKSYLEKDELKDDDCIALAIEKELLQKNELQSTFTEEECEVILERASQLSLLLPEETEDVTEAEDASTYDEEDSSEEPNETSNAEDVLFTVTDECQYWFDINNDSGLSFDGTKYYAIGTLGYVVKVPYNPAILQMQLGEKLEICGQRWTSVALSSDEAFYISYDDEGEPTGENPDEWRKLKCDETDATFYLNLSEIYNPETEDRKRIALTDADSSYPGYEFATYGNAVMGGKGLAWASLKKNYRQEFAPDGIIEFSSLYALLSDVRSYSVKEYYQNPVQDDFGRDLVNPCETEVRSGFITLNDQNRVCYYCYFADSPVYEWW